MTLKPMKISQLVLSIFFFAGLLAWFAATPTPVFAAEIETLGCSETPVEGDLCITVNDTGRFSTQRYINGSWVLVTDFSGAVLQAGGAGYNLGYVNSGDAARVSNTRAADTVTTVLDAGGLVYTQAITYTSGDEWVNYHWSIANPGSDASNLRFIHVGKHPYGYSKFYEPTWNGSDTVGATFSLSDALLVYELQGVTAPDAYQSDYSWRIDESAGIYTLDNILEFASYNSYALQWNRAGLAGGATWQIDARERFTLDAPRPMLRIEMDQANPGGGTITSSPAGINCGPASGAEEHCKARFADNASVTLTATPEVGYEFQNWYDYGNSRNRWDNPYTVRIEDENTIIAYYRPAPVNISITVTDGSGHAGMALPAHIIAISEGNDDVHGITDPFSGQVSLELLWGTEYTLWVFAPGYLTQQRTVQYSAAAASETFSMLPDPAAGCPVGYQLSGDQSPITALAEGFESGVFPPAGWRKDITGEGEPAWAASTDAHTGSFSLSIISPGSGENVYDHLTSLPIRIPVNAQLTFYQKVSAQVFDPDRNFDHILNLYDHENGEMWGYPYNVDPPADGDTWQQESYDLSSYAGRDLSLFFSYFSGDDDQWFIDDIRIEGTQGTCEALPGGRVAGYITDVNTGEYVGSPTVTVNGGDADEKEPFHPSGYYAVWAPAGEVQLEASAYSHLPASQTVAVIADSTIRQDFALQYGYLIDTFTTGGGSGTVSEDPGGPYESGAVASLTAIPSADSQFAGWSGNGVVAGHELDNPLVITVTDHVSVTARFDRIENPLTVTVSGSGTVTRSPDRETYHIGDQVTLTATPDQHFLFSGWGGDIISVANPITITINGETEVTAAFTPAYYSLIVTVTGSGTVARSPNQDAFHFGDQVTLTAIPDQHSHFTGWGGDAGGTTNPITITINVDTEVTAAFAPADEYSLTVDVVGGGTVTPDRPGPYHLNDLVRLTAVPGANYHFSAWGGDASGSSETVDVTITGNMLVTARFDPFQADLALHNSTTLLGQGRIRYQINVANYGPDPANGARLTGAFGSGLADITWVCTAGGSAVCPHASGGSAFRANAAQNAGLDETIAQLPAGGWLIYTITASIGDPGAASFSAAITPPGAMVDPDTTDDTVTGNLFQVAIPMIIKQ